MKFIFKYWATCTCSKKKTSLHCNYYNYYFIFFLHTRILYFKIIKWIAIASPKIWRYIILSKEAANIVLYVSPILMSLKPGKGEHISARPDSSSPNLQLNALHELFNVFCFLSLNKKLKNQSSNINFCKQKLQHLLDSPILNLFDHKYW